MAAAENKGMGVDVTLGPNTGCTCSGADCLGRGRCGVWDGVGWMVGEKAGVFTDQ